MNKRYNSGITLIALIITIIALLILAGITISLVVGDNGILSRSTQAKADSIIAQEKEQMNLAYSAAFTKKLGDTVTSEELQDELDKIVGEGKTAVTGTTTFKVKFKETNNEYSISQNGKVGEYEKPEVTSVYAAVCQNGYLVFSNNEADINNYLVENNTSLSDGYEIRDIKDDVYCQGHTDETTGEWIDDNFPVWKYNRNIKHAIFLNTVVPKTTACWFYGLDDMASIENIQNLDTSNVTDMSYMFYNCYKDSGNVLSNLDLSSFDTSNVTDMNHMFFCIVGIRTLNISSFDTSNVTDMSYMFAGGGEDSNYFRELDLSNFNTKKVRNMEGMFKDSRELTSLNLSGFDTSNVTNMAYMFCECNNLTSLNLSSFNTSNVTDMTYMFQCCSNLTSLDLSNFNTSNVTSMNQMFCECSTLTSLDLSSFDTSNVTNMDTMFSYCSSLTSLDVSNFNTSAVTTTRQMFLGCSNLTSLDLSRFNTSNVTNMRSMFSDCRNLATIYVGPNWTTSSVTSSADMFSSCTALVGGNGTTFNDLNRNAAYARVDDPPTSPGYFTLKSN